jgi:hypothetical protein
MPTHIRSAHLPLCFALATAACSDDYEHSLLPPTSTDSGATEDTSGAVDTGDSTQSGPHGEGSTGSVGDDTSTSGNHGDSEDSAATEASVDTSSSGSESSSSGVPEPTCDAMTHRCTPLAPDGWNGPVALTSTAASARGDGCEGDYGDPLVVGFTELVAPPATCDCACGGVEDAECEDETSINYFPPNYLFAGTNTAGCELSADMLSVSGLQEYDAVTPSRWIANEVDAVGGACDATATADVEVAAFTGRTQGCGPTAVPESCDDGSLCMPIPAEPFEAPLCVWKTGADSCPAEYPEQQIVYDDFTDDRGCSACGCGAPTGMTCDDSSFYLWTGLTPHELPANGNCQYIGAGPDVTSVSYASGSVSGGECAPSGGDPSGTAEPVEPTTICCES